jgi:predicted ATP-grasp superfamily ATP-dependent carboligase
MAPLTIHSLPQGLRRPVLITAFSGWNDAAEAATTAARYLATSFQAEKFAEIDPEEFYHFGLSRPYVRYKSGSETEREIVWPATEFSVARAAGLSRDVIVAVATEPHLKWRTYCANVLELASRCEATLVLTLGALLAEVPHTRPVRISGSASDPELAAQLGVRPSRYEGPTGIVGVLHAACQEAGVPTASLWASVPHYVAAAPNPKAALALVRKLEGLVGVSVDAGELESAAADYERQVSLAVQSDPDVQAFVERLEQAAEEEEPPVSPQDLPSGDTIAREFQRFLRQRGPEAGGPGGSGGPGGRP